MLSIQQGGGPTGSELPFSSRQEEDDELVRSALAAKEKGTPSVYSAMLKPPATLIVKGFSSKEECIKAATTIQSVARGRQGCIKFRYFMLLKQLNGADEKKEHEIRQIRKETKRKKEEFLKDAKARAKKNSDSEESHKLKQLGLEESHKLWKTLREDNSIVQSQNAKIDQNIENLRLNNSTLSNLAEKKGDALRRWEARYRRLLKDNEELTQAKTDRKKILEVLEERLDLKTKYASSEHIIKLLYENTIRDTIKLATARGDDTMVRHFNGYKGLLDKLKAELIKKHATNASNSRDV
jgi:hypothetical protein